MFERLPQSAWPLGYDLRIRTDLEKQIFDGEVSITILVKEPQGVSELRLNALDLEIGGIQLESEKGDWESVPSFRLVEEKEELEVQLGRNMPVQSEFRLRIRFEGILNDKLRGYYRTMQEGNPRFGAVCHFEATGARMAFPCWDDPRFRAELKLIMDIRKDQELVALSNMPEKMRSDIDGDWVRIEFEKTPKLPTYLMCWSVGEFDHITGHTKSAVSVPVSVYTPNGKREQGQFALEVAIGALDFYTDFFGVPYQLPKMDMLALSDFAIGAMENWGLLTYRERFLLYDPNSSSNANKQICALIVAHEVAHQWFGNYVTIEWWTHLWLKEGYATWIEFLCVDHLFPEFKIWTQFLTDTFNPARSLDALEHSHPIEVEVENPKQIDEIFDLISYNKGASIIRMLFNWIGEESFKKGMNTYLESKRYGNASTKDLWTALDSACGLGVDKVMSTWTLQQGYPLLTVEIIGETSLKITQKLFRMGVKADSKHELQQTSWAIPFSVTSKSSPDSPIYSGLLKEKEEIIQLNLKKGDWINLNPNSIGYYRVEYPVEIMNNFLSSIKDLTLSSNDRLNLLSDQLALAQNGQVSTKDLMKLIENYRNDDNVTVWECVESCLKSLKLMFFDNNNGILDKLNRWAIWLFKPSLKNLGWEKKPSDNHLTELFRALVIRNLIGSGEEKTIDEALKRFNVRDEISPDLRSSIYKAQMKAKPAESFKKLTELSQQIDSHEEKIRIYESLGACNHQETVNATLEFALSDRVRFQDTRTVILGVAEGSKEGRDRAWQFFKENATEFKTRYKQGGLLTNIVKAVTMGLVGDESAKDVGEFFEKANFPGAERTIKQAVEKIRLRTEWKKRGQKEVIEFLDASEWV